MVIIVLCFANIKGTSVNIVDGCFINKLNKNLEVKLK